MKIKLISVIIIATVIMGCNSDKEEIETDYIGGLEAKKDTNGSIIVADFYFDKDSKYIGVDEYIVKGIIDVKSTPNDDSAPQWLIRANADSTRGIAP